MRDISEAPAELQVAICEFWPESEWNHAASIAFLESHWDAFAVNDTRRSDAPCGAIIGMKDGVAIAAEWSIGYFQLNACNFEGWEPGRFYNARHNAGTAHHLWSTRGWRPWYFSAKTLGLIP